MSQFIDRTTPPSADKPLRLPADLPHGLLAPPEQVRELLERERTRHAPAAFAAAFERLLNEWTVAYYFDGLGHEIVYRPTAQGPEVLAVGLEEVLALKKSMPIEEQRRLKTVLGY
jgi:hypothetical protein